jgi:hypothetical protein
MPDNQMPAPSRSTLRLTFAVSNGAIKLISHERLAMITPPQTGETPQAGKHSGFWLELRDGADKCLAHRLISRTLLNSVEVHSPDGKIQRQFGEVKQGIFEVLLPDTAGARAAVLMGDPLVREKSAMEKEPASGELARFEIPPAREGR